MEFLRHLPHCYAIIAFKVNRVEDEHFHPIDLYVCGGEGGLGLYVCGGEGVNGERLL